MLTLPSIYRNQGRWWHGGFDMHGNEGGRWSAVQEFFWIVRHGKFRACWQWPELIFGIGRTWYDGPIWFAHLGIFSIDLSP